MRAANRGDAVAYRRLLDAITPVLRGVVRARGASLGHEAREDVVQEVLLAVHLKRQTWREDQPLRPWLYAIARHKVVDAFRARGQRVDLPIERLRRRPARGGCARPAGRDATWRRCFAGSNPGRPTSCGRSDCAARALPRRPRGSG
jgi:DNA-directed RNA polymerase specialized sigma24 family protein